MQPDEMTFSSLIATTRDGSDRSPDRGFAVSNCHVFVPIPTPVPTPFSLLNEVHGVVEIFYVCRSCLPRYATEISMEWNTNDYVGCPNSLAPARPVR